MLKLFEEPLYLFANLNTVPVVKLKLIDCPVCCIALLMHVVCSHWYFAIHFSGFVKGESGAEPRLMQFHPHFQHGALLTVVSVFILC